MFYGTLQVDTVPFNQLELSVYLQSKQSMRRQNETLFMIMFWPVSWIWGLIAALFNYQHKSTIARSFFISALGLLWCCVPFSCIYTLGRAGLVKQIKARHISVWEVLGPCMDHALFVYCLVMAYTIYQYSLNMSIIRKAARESFESQRHEHGMSVYVDESTAWLSARLYHDPAQQANRQIYLKSILNLLEEMPGWKSRHVSPPPDFQVDLYGETNVFTKTLHGMRCDGGLLPIEQIARAHFNEEPDSFPRQISVLLRGALLATTEMWKCCCESWRAPLCVSVAVFRALIPRLWIRFYFKGPAIPPNAPSLVLVLFAFMESAIATFVLMTLLMGAQSRYHGNEEQLLLLSALVDPQLRLSCSRMLLKHQTRLRSEDEMLPKIPMLQLTRSDNTRAFARLREYVELDRVTDRHCISEMIEVMLLWVLLNTALTLGEVMFHSEVLTAGFPTNIFDYLVASTLVTIVLQDALQVNSIRKRHVQVLEESRYRTTEKLTQLEAAKAKLKSTQPDELTDNSEDEEADEKKHVDTTITKTDGVAEEAASLGVAARTSSDNLISGMDIAKFSTDALRNPQRQQHRQAPRIGKHQLDLKIAQKEYGELLHTDSVMDTARKKQEANAIKADISIAIRLQTHLINHFEANDVYDQPLFGLEVTPGSFVSIMFTLVAGFCTLLGTYWTISPTLATKPLETAHAATSFLIRLVK